MTHDRYVFGYQPLHRSEASSGDDSVCAIGQRLKRCAKDVVFGDRSAKVDGSSYENL